MTVDLPSELKLYGKPRNFERILLLILIIIWIPFSIIYKMQIFQNIILTTLVLIGIIISADKIWIIKENQIINNNTSSSNGIILIERLRYNLISFQSRKNNILDFKVLINLALNNHPFSCKILILESENKIHKLKFSKKQVNETKDFFDILGINVKISKFTMKR